MGQLWPPRPGGCKATGNCHRAIAYHPAAAGFEMKLVPGVAAPKLTPCRGMIHGSRVILPNSRTGPRCIWLGRPARQLLAVLPRTQGKIFSCQDTLRTGKICPAQHKTERPSRLIIWQTTLSPKAGIHLFCLHPDTYRNARGSAKSAVCTLFLRVIKRHRVYRGIADDITHHLQHGGGRRCRGNHMTKRDRLAHGLGEDSRIDNANLNAIKHQFSPPFRASEWSNTSATSLILSLSLRAIAAFLPR